MSRREPQRKSNKCQKLVLHQTNFAIFSRFLSPKRMLFRKWWTLPFATFWKYIGFSLLLLFFLLIAIIIRCRAFILIHHHSTRWFHNTNWIHYLSKVVHFCTIPIHEWLQRHLLQLQRRSDITLSMSGHRFPTEYRYGWHDGGEVIIATVHCEAPNVP